MFLFGGKVEKEKEKRVSFREANTLEQRISLRSKFEEKYPKDRFALVVLEGIDEFDPKAKSFTMSLSLYLVSAFNIISLSSCCSSTSVSRSSG